MEEIGLDVKMFGSRLQPANYNILYHEILIGTYTEA